MYLPWAGILCGILLMLFVAVSGAIALAVYLQERKENCGRPGHD